MCHEFYLIYEGLHNCLLYNLKQYSNFFLWILNFVKIVSVEEVVYGIWSLFSGSDFSL